VHLVTAAVGAFYVAPKPGFVAFQSIRLSGAGLSSMADSGIPDKLLPAVRLAVFWIALPFIFLLVASDRYFAGTGYEVAVCIAGAFLSIVIAVYWDKIFRRHNLTAVLWGVAVIGLLLFGGAIGALAVRGGLLGGGAENSQETTKTVVIHDPPTAEQIAKAAGEALRTITAQRDQLQQDNDTLRKTVSQLPPPPVPPKTMPDDVKARLRPQIGDLATIFDLSGFPVWRLTKKLLDEVGDFQNPDGGPDELSRSPDALISRLSELNDKAQAFSDTVFKDFLPSHQYDKSELSALVGDDKAIYAFTQAVLGLIGDLHTVLIVEEKSTDKNFTKSYAMSLLVQKYRTFMTAAENLKKWFDACNQRLQQEKQFLQ
jgi:hypothetical protein